MMPLTTNLKEAYQQGRDDEQNFIQNLALFLVTVLREHASRLFESDEYKVNLHCHVTSTLRYSRILPVGILITLHCSFTNKFTKLILVM